MTFETIAWFCIGLALLCSGIMLGPMRAGLRSSGFLFWLSILLAIGGWAIMATMFGVWVS